MKTAYDLLREALRPKNIDKGTEDLIAHRDQRAGNTIPILQDVCDLTRLRRLVVAGRVKVPA